MDREAIRRPLLSQEGGIGRVFTPVQRPMQARRVWCCYPGTQEAARGSSRITRALQLATA